MMNLEEKQKNMRRKNEEKPKVGRPAKVQEIVPDEATRARKRFAAHCLLLRGFTLEKVAFLTGYTIEQMRTWDSMGRPLAGPCIRTDGATFPLDDKPFVSMMKGVNEL